MTSKWIAQGCSSMLSTPVALLFVVAWAVIFPAKMVLAQPKTVGAGDTRSSEPLFYRSVKLSEKPAVSERSWEARPYQVAVWICHRGQPQYASIENQLIVDVEKYCRLQDASSWFVTVGTPPSDRRHELLRLHGRSQQCRDLTTDPELQFYDKVMIVWLKRDRGGNHITVRECDLQTGQWGPTIERRTSSTERLAAQIANGIQQAFMPVAIIERIDDKNKVHIRSRAIESCVRVEFKGDMDAQVVPIETSPAYIRPEDRFLPILRRTTRRSDSVSLDPVPFTFLTVDSIEGPKVVASIFSSQRAPLSQRRSKRLQKLAIVVRPAERSTILKLQSNEKQPIPLEGYEIFSRKPTDTKDIKSEFIGKTDWRGFIEIPPSDESLRLIYVKRGARALRRLPIIPGFKDELVAQLPNDNARLFAEGIIRGYQNDVINLIVQRELLEADIADAVDQGKFDEANQRLLEYKNLETPVDIKLRMSSEEVRLKNMANSERESEFITNMFSNLRTILNDKVSDSNEVELQQQIQDQILAKNKKAAAN